MRIHNLCLDLIGRQSVQQRAVPSGSLFRHPRPRGRILAQGRVAVVDRLEESLSPVGLERRRDDQLHRPPFGGSEAAKQ